MRLRYIDFTKGLAIILMIFGHTMSKINCLHIWIYSFHMPIFFIICGIIMCRKGRQKSYSLLKEKIIRRWYTLGIPYLFFGGVLILFYTILDLLDGQPISFFSRLLRVITFQGIDALWFIPVYCFSEIIMKIIYKYKWRDIIIVNVPDDCVGNVIEKLGRIKYILLIIAAMLAQVNGSVEMIEGRIGNPVVYFLCATMTSVSVLALFKNAESNNSKLLLVLEKYGKNTIVLLVTNNLLIEMIRLIDYKITGNILIRLGIFGSILFTVGLLIIEWWFIKVANGPLGFLFGRMREEER